MIHRAKSVRILVVDDEVAHTQALCDTLRDHGYDTFGVTSGEAAVALLRETRFELLLTDLVLPGIDGLGLLRAAREMDEDLVGIVMTGEGTVTTAVEAMKGGALDFILKPFKLSMIVPSIARALTMRQLRIDNAALARRLHERAAELEAANKELDTFSYTVSHDLRAPLRIVDGYLHMIEEHLGDKVDDEGRAHFRLVFDSTVRMGVMIDELLAFSKLGRQQMRVVDVDMTALVNETWEEICVGLPPDRYQFSVIALPRVFGDLTLLRQVWRNLLSNAAKYSAKAEAPQIEVKGWGAGKEAMYTVKDNGAGFDMREYARLFEVFKRLHSEQEFAGTGVGLAIVQRIVSRHGGRVWAEGELGRGATFYFTLPRWHV